MKADLNNHYCPNHNCRKYGRKDQGNIEVAKTYGEQSRRLLNCTVCETKFSETRNTIFWNKQHTKEKILDVLRCLCEGNGIRATERITGVTRKTISKWLDEASAHCEEVDNCLLRDLHVTEAQLDEFWSFVKKRKRG